MRASGSRDQATAHMCPLCKDTTERVGPGWDWIHLVLQCTNPVVTQTRGMFLEDAITYLRRPEHIVAFYATQRDVPDSIRGLPYQTLKQDSILGVVALGIAVWLAGGCLHNPQESTFLLSQGLFSSLPTLSHNNS